MDWEYLGDWAAWTLYWQAILALVITVIIIFTLNIIKILASRLKQSKQCEGTITVGFFHPYCNAGGGGEKVLWCAVRALHARYPAAKCVIFTGDTDAAPDQILSRARERFDMEIPEKGLEFVYLSRRRYLEAAMWPRFTMLGQSLGSVILGVEALLSFVPDIYIDTMGYAFTMPLFKYLGGCKVGCYVHYPTISTDMLAAVKARRRGFNNRGFVSRNPIVTFVKVQYYKLFAVLYGLVGRTSDIVMVNSSWTEEHINDLWRRKGDVHKVFPPCDVKHLTKLVSTREDKDKHVILSLGQFRPEKDHPLQIKMMFELRQVLPEEDWNKVKLVIIGGCRNKVDETLVQDLKDLTRYLSVEDNVEFMTNLPFPELMQQLGGALMGIHTMWNEHFGIGVVEMMAAGLMTVAHRSGGPLMDIIVEETGSRNGFLAVNSKEYAAQVAYILSMTEDARETIRARAKASVNMFSSQQFESGWLRAVQPLFSQLS